MILLYHQLRMGKGVEYIFYTFLLFWNYGGEGFLHGIVLPISIQGVACRRLAVKEWNHGVGGGVGVMPVSWIGMFRYCRMAQATLSL